MSVYFMPSSNQGQDYILTYFLPLCLLPVGDQTRFVQLGLPNLFTEVKTCGLLSSVNNSPQNSRKLSVLGQVGLIH